VLRQPPPSRGIYVVEVRRAWPGVASVGRRPTVNPVACRYFEVHSVERTRDLYGEHLQVRFLKKLRDEQKYDDLGSCATRSRATRAGREYFAKAWLITKTR
jgi:riboflavin kinase/FMN adenylyltransferase